MARLIERTFHPDKPLVARRRFVAAGRHFHPGDEFPWRNMSVSIRQAGLLFNNGKVMHTDEGTAQRPVPRVTTPTVEVDEPVTAPVQTDDAPTIQQETQDEDTHHVAVTADETGTDDLADLNMKELREIAEREDAPSRVSRAKQIEAIRENRRERRD